MVMIKYPKMGKCRLANRLAVNYFDYLFTFVNICLNDH